ncbi:NUDIX domain-containing protein [Agromyces mediolanus]|uniref:NUDIX domain-containing protein n=1 Tax=Agromyces mediolanus TaxID=41986 RepID=UPI003834DA1F
MPVTSAGLLLHRDRGEGLEVFLGHMGGPYWAKKDAAAWSIPKGELEAGEDPLAAARREFTEEIGVPPPDGEPAELGAVRYASGKTVYVFALAAPEFAIERVVSGTFELEWPPHSGRRVAFPEVDRAEWMPLGIAAERLVVGQRPALSALVAHLGGAAEGGGS